MTDFTLVQALESRLINAWPSFETQVADGWILRFAKGYSKRANAATPLVPGVTLDEALIDHIVAQYEARRIRPTFRLTSLEASGVDERLANRGFVEIEPTYGMVAELPGDFGEDIGDESSVQFEASVNPRWVRAAASAYGGDKADDSILIEIVSRIRHPAAFATLSLDEQPAAWGLAVAERGYVGLYDIVVSPDLRGLGLSRTMVMNLMRWGAKSGASRAYLQVRESNEVARALYRSLGFADAYRYTHRVTPERSGAAARSR
jgi:ribosomal protein S18 acetylase RimI-like enzyme